ncbi:MAG TPA: sulfotransferase [Actinomycetota bacterium]|nr:sulfotransferase [Actinomycetota bacterium]
MTTHAPGRAVPSPAVESTGSATSPARLPRSVPGPVFIAGADRTGTTLMFALLGSHPNISMVRRTNMWRYFHRRFGDLGDPRNFDRCLDAMSRYRRLHPLHPDPERIRREFLEGEATYGRLFSLFFEHHAERAGKTRWGDKSLHTEHYAERVFEEFPDARIIHMIRDPRDRYASVRKRHRRDLSRVGAATGRWLDSTTVGRRNRARFADRYLMVRYEDLARDPERTLRSLCDFIGEDYSPAMLSMEGAPRHRGGGNSSFGDLERGAISTRGIGRFASVLSPSEIAFIELVAGKGMAALGYGRMGANPPRLRYLGTLPFQLTRMIGWMTLARINRWRGARVPPARVSAGPQGAKGE